MASQKIFKNEQPTGFAENAGKPAFCTSREAANALGVSLRTAQLWVESGILDAWKTEGGHRRISVASVERLMRDGVPANAQGGSDAASARVAEASLERLRVLVVEDDNVLLKLYKARIGAWGMPIDVFTAGNGYEGLIRIGRDSPDLMIADLSMPGMDGFQMIRHLCASSFREGMEIVVVTGYDATQIAANGGLPEDVQVFSKPVPFAELRTLAENLLSRRAAL